MLQGYSGSRAVSGQPFAVSHAQARFPVHGTVGVLKTREPYQPNYAV